MNKLHKRLVSMAREDKRVRLLMSAPGVGVLVGLTYVAAVNDPGRFRSSFWLDTEEVSIRGDRRYRADFKDRRRKRPYHALRSRQCYSDSTSEGILPKELGYADRQASRNAQGKGSSGAQACCGPSPHADRWDRLRRRQGSRRRVGQKGAITSSGDPRHQSPGAGPVAGTMDQARPQRREQTIRSPRMGLRILRLAGRSSSDPHQVAASR